MPDYRPPQLTVLPPVVKNLLIINGIFFLASLVFQNIYGIELSDRLGLHYPTSEKFRIYQFITYMFMHATFEHILFNMLALWMFGYAIENYWGPKRFLNYYLFCGLGAAVTHYIIYYFQIRNTIGPINDYLAHPDLSAFANVLAKLPKFQPEDISVHLQNVFSSFENSTDANEQLRLSSEILSQYKIDFLNAPVVVGASGSIFGLLLAFGMMFPNSMVYIYFFLPMKAKYFVIIYGAIELFSGIRSNPGDNVAHFAHLGGMLFGFILMMYWKNKNKRNFIH